MGKRKNNLRGEWKRQQLATANPDGWSKHNEYHWYRMVNGMKVDYWPSTRKAMYNKKVYFNVVDGNEFEWQLKNAFPHGALKDHENMPLTLYNYAEKIKQAQEIVQSLIDDTNPAYTGARERLIKINKLLMGGMRDVHAK